MSPDPHEDDNEESTSNCDFVRVISHLPLRSAITLDSIGHLTNCIILQTGMEIIIVIKRTYDQSMKPPVPPRPIIWHEDSGADHGPAVSPEPCRKSDDLPSPGACMLLYLYIRYNTGTSSVRELPRVSDMPVLT